MTPQNALVIAKVVGQEIRVLLRENSIDKSLEIAEALRNLPLDGSNAAQAYDTERTICRYLKRYPHRQDLPHWKTLLDIMNFSVIECSLPKTVFTTPSSRQM